MTSVDAIREDSAALLAALRDAGADVSKPNAIRCPFHDDANPSAGVYQADCVWRFKCHGCGVNLDVFDVEAKASGRDVAEVLRDHRGRSEARSYTSTAVGNDKARIVAQYDYRDEAGNVVFQAVRFEPKGFRQRRSKPGGGWDWRVKGARVIPYCLPKVLADPEQPVVVVEGEKDCDNLHRIGVLATCNAGGAGKWSAEHAAFLKGRRVLILPDNDDTGRNHAQQVARSLHRIAESVRIVELPDLPAKGDVSDWLAAGGSKAELDRLADAAPVCTPENESADPTPRHGPRLIRMSDVEPTNINWLWPSRVPLGRLTLLVGRPGDGKSFLTAHMAANVSRGRNWIDGSACPRGSVVLCSAEDDPADTIAPRLIAHDADRERVHLLAGVLSQEDDGEEVERVFTLTDLPALRHTLEQLADCKLIVVDPIGSYLGGQADAHRDNEVRAVLAPVCHLAAQYEAAVVVVAHIRKAIAANADDMVMGSRAFTGLARSVLHLMIDPDDETKRRRLLLPGKNNLAERPPGLAFEIGPGEIESRPSVRWLEGEVTITADEVVNRDPQRDGRKCTERAKAVDWLRRTLAHGPMQAREVQELAKDSASIAPRTLDRAKKMASVEAYRPENPGPWYWRLPGTQAERHDTKGEGGGALAWCPDDGASGDSEAPSVGTSPERHTSNAWRPALDGRTIQATTATISPAVNDGQAEEGPATPAPETDSDDDWGEL